MCIYDGLMSVMSSCKLNCMDITMTMSFDCTDGLSVYQLLELSLDYRNRQYYKYKYHFTNSRFLYNLTQHQPNSMNQLLLPK